VPLSLIHLHLSPPFIIYVEPNTCNVTNRGGRHPGFNFLLTEDFSVKNAFAVLALGLMVVGSVACSNAPKKEEAPKAQDTVSATTEKPADTSATSAKDLSLGASSSGLGH
jgi:hypothetical protein